MRPSLAPSTALKSLPELIASSSTSAPLPSSSRLPLRSPIFIRPASFPANSYYAITRTKLKFTPVDQVAKVSNAQDPRRVVAAASAGAGAAKGAGRSQGGGVEKAEGRSVGEEGVGEVRVSGKAWGRLYWDGKAVPPTSRSGNPLPKPDTLIHGGNKRKWVMADPSLITNTVLDELDALRREAREARGISGAVKAGRRSQGRG